MALRIKDWHKFQHFKDRRPPWVKLYRHLLDDVEWHELSGDSAKTLVMLWLIASEDDGALPEVRKLAFRLRVTEKALKEQISELSHWLSQDDDAVISGRYQGDITPSQNSTATEVSEYQETETETERETDSVSKDTGADAPDAIWETGLQYLIACNVPEKGARSFLGKMRKTLNNDLLCAELLTKAQQQHISEPLSWLRAAAGRNTQDGRTKTGVAL